ncbi:glycosyltransferase family 4 protein [Vibrio salinus]|uniref:glycosyltransferase family 4 protein n=1 Tax=Vibrio salinus TaxID=2899784 RepID=UPI001E53F504|nr:glycosyltransferase family 4 protein [Vibrio salinus]MCE0493267.1 glycosyltransferase family 4 protein [Vibrio salinus]
MKILYHHRIASKDGQYVHVEEIIKALTSLGHEVIIIAPEVTKNAKFGSDGGWISKLRSCVPKAISELLEFGYSLFVFVKLCLAVIQHRPDGIYERYNLFLPAGIWVKKIFGLKLLLEVNSPLYEERKKYGGISLDRLARWSERYVWQNADQVLPVTNVLASFIIKAGVPKERITVIPNGIDQKRFYHTENVQRTDKFCNKLVIGFVGFCREWHRLDEVMTLVANEKNPDLIFLIVGDGPVSEQLKTLSKSLNIEKNFHITGLVEREDMPYWLDQIDIAIQPAVTPWASPLKLIEYLAKGKAIIAPDTENIRELLQDKHNALLFDEQSNDSIIDCLKYLLKDPILINKIKLEALNTIQQKNLTWISNAEKIISLFE